MLDFFYRKVTKEWRVFAERHHQQQEPGFICIFRAAIAKLRGAGCNREAERSRVRVRGDGPEEAWRSLEVRGGYPVSSISFLCSSSNSLSQAMLPIPKKSKVEAAARLDWSVAMAGIVRQSKFRHVFCKPVKHEQCMSDIR
ncbi:unnamed protein product, partial [Cylicostephanus goldi]